MQNQRRVILINPRFQGRVALLFAAVILLGGAVLAFMIYREAREALWDASVRGHFQAGLTPYRIVEEILIRHLAVLVAGILLASFLLFFLLMRSIGAGIQRLVDVLRLSGEGDLSTPTRAPGPGEIASFGEQLDGIRARTLTLIDEIRSEAGSLRNEALPPEAFRQRWEELKTKVGRLAP
ncbi:MAG: hypothetical protein HZA60_11200 [Deltaproteobacteria bacterium]|nr:hypothetical protein [Deltaproteobacteria bacterium]